MNNKEYQAKYYQKNRKKILEQQREYHKKYPNLRRNSNKKVKIEVLTHYGDRKCACVICGESRLACLSLDHTKNNGAEERRKLGKPKYFGGPTFYRWLRKRNYPDGYQTLCMNCQWVKRIANTL